MWFRRDLRLKDNTALQNALSESNKLSCIFIFDEHILKNLSPIDRRITFIWESLEDMNRQLAESHAGPVYLFFGKPEEIIPRIVSDSNIDAVYVNHDYEPAAIERDKKLELICLKDRIHFKSYKDQVIFEKSEIVKSDGSPYKVFTAYKNRWIEKLEDIPFFRTTNKLPWEKITPLFNDPSMIQQLDDIHFIPVTNIIQGGETACKSRWMKFLRNDLEGYVHHRNFPGLNKTSFLSAFLRFGNISVRDLVETLRNSKAIGARAFLSELIWREFFMMILFHYPHVVTRSFNAQFDSVQWQNRQDRFRAWCGGNTGFPIVDAGMRQLNETGFMHNRVRMITASFLVKHLHVDWRWGEKYFADKLLDYELSSNNGNWQWAAGTGVDAAPYFRIFNPLTQSKKFDPEGMYTKRWVPELKNCAPNEVHEPHKKVSVIKNYPSPIIDLASERKNCLAMYNHRSDRTK